MPDSPKIRTEGRSLKDPPDGPLPLDTARCLAVPPASPWIAVTPGGSDGHHVWETDAKVDKDSFKSNTLVVEIPPYRNQRLSSPAQVNFYVCNGKRKRSQCQRFTYLPANGHFVPIIKTEPSDEYDSPRLPPQPYYGQPHLSPITSPPLGGDGEPCLVGDYAAPCPAQRVRPPPPSPGSSPTLHDLSAPPPVAAGGAYGSKCLPCGPAAPGSAASSSSSSSSSSTSSSPGSHPSTPGGTGPAAESPFMMPAYSPVQSQQPPAAAAAAATLAAAGGSTRGKGGNPPAQEDASPPATPLPVTVKQEPQELDQMYLDDVNEIIRNDLSSISTPAAQHCLTSILSMKKKKKKNKNKKKKNRRQI
ncbi:hypothetical protein CRUP_012977 [Coryphaenoides rupestris]|nr:hypothetical protein CRUP_012977 [Coryphaenoides rupestris]